ncbi:MAG: MBL fold metallo-hydrolase, partial [Candidatus Bathyarchaeia archaeon]
MPRTQATPPKLHQLVPSSRRHGIGTSVNIKPLAGDSLGTRSMAVGVETRDVKLVIDPSAALGPRRYGLPPHPLERRRLRKHWKRITGYARDADVIIVTHYHYDHHNPDENLDIYAGRTVLVKHPTHSINRSQMRRAAYFLEKLKNTASSVRYCDGHIFKFGSTTTRFSKAVFHGTDPTLGYVVECLVEEGSDRFIHTSDVEGPTQLDQLQFILKHKPNVVLLDGPLTYMLGTRFSPADLDASLRNMVKIVERCPLETLIVDHHLLRDLQFRERI